VIKVDAVVRAAHRTLQELPAIISQLVAICVDSFRNPLKLPLQVLPHPDEQLARLGEPAAHLGGLIWTDLAEGSCLGIMLEIDIEAPLEPASTNQECSVH